jgi:hypothetical protein
MNMKKIILGVAMSLVAIVINAQTLTGTVTTQPCNNNGVYQVTAAGLTAPISYTYYTGGSIIVHTNVNSLTDQLTNFSASGGYITCYASDGVNFAYANATYTMPFYVNVNSTSPICPNITGTLSASTHSGTAGPFSYTWTEINTLATYTGSNIAAPLGDYTLSVMDQVTGCFVNLTDSSLNLNQLSNISITYSTTTANCTNGTASITATGGVLPYTYQWNNGANTPSIGGLVQGIYTATVTDAQGCVSNGGWNAAYVQQAISINVNASVTNATCIQTDGSAIAFASGGMPPYSYLWSNAQTGQTLTAVPAGNYHVLATDANGCISSQTGIYINTSTPISVTNVVTASSCTTATGSAALTITGGTTPYTIAWNTSPALSGATITGRQPGTYAFTVTDAAGCKRTGTVYIPPVSTINANAYASTVICPANTGNVLTSVSGSNPPFTYAWSNGSTASQLNNVPLGGYSCVITDAVGCSATKYVSVYALSSVNIGIAPTAASCKFTADGSVTATATGGSSPYTYHWSNGQTGPNATGLLTGNIWVTVTDANGCSASDHAFVSYNASNTSCYCTITGKVYQDANNNCAIDGGENGIQNIMIHCAGAGYAFTDANGNYSFQVPTGTYTLSESVNSNYPLAACQSNAMVTSVTAGSGCTTTVNFANNVIVQHDLHLLTTSYPYSAPIPGNPYYQRVIIQNDGTVAEGNIQVAYVNDGQLGAMTSSPALFTQQDAINYPNWYSIQSGFANLVPGTSGQINLTYNTPTNIPLNTVVNFYDSTAQATPINTNWLLDESPWNNVQNYQQTVIGSFDPNFKEVSPKGNGPQGYIATKDSVLDYVIHFQNEGTYYAQTISVVDTLDSDLDWSTLRPGYSDHHYTTTVSENGVVTFKFANINLPWKSQYGDVMSSGMVAYTIKSRHNLAQGTQIKNKAAIYFDFNAPVITNTTLNTLNDLLSSVEENTVIENGDIVLFPNPTSSLLNVTINSKVSNNAVVNVLDLSGKVLKTKQLSVNEGRNTLQEDVSGLPSGIYFVQVKCNESMVTKKLVIIK